MLERGHMFAGKLGTVHWDKKIVSVNIDGITEDSSIALIFNSKIPVKFPVYVSLIVHVTHLCNVLKLFSLNYPFIKHEAITRMTRGFRRGFYLCSPSHSIVIRGEIHVECFLSYPLGT